MCMQVSCHLAVIYPHKGYHKGQPYVNDPNVKSFIQWTKTLKDNIVLQKTVVGGHYRYPHPPQKCAQSTADASGEGKTHDGSGHEGDYGLLYWLKNA